MGRDQDLLGFVFFMCANDIVYQQVLVICGRRSWIYGLGSEGGAGAMWENYDQFLDRDLFFGSFQQQTARVQHVACVKQPNLVRTFEFI